MRQNENVSDLRDLIQQYPDLPVVPILIPYLVGDYDSSVPGKIDCGFVGECICIGKPFDVPMLYDFYLKSDNKIDEIMEYYFDSSDLERLRDEGGNIEQVYNALPWKKAIIVEIGIAIL